MPSTLTTLERYGPVGRRASVGAQQSKTTLSQAK
jgi:hypothetical protein